MNQVPAEWLKWIDDNLARGVPQQSLIDTMVEHRFDRTVAMHAVLSRTPGFLLQRQSPIAALEAANARARTAAARPATSGRPAENGYDYTGVGIEVGNTVDIDGHRISVLMKIDRPKVILFGNVLTREECATLVELSKSRLSRSTTVDELTGQAQPHEHRTSFGTFFRLREDPFIARIDERVAKLMQLPAENGEGLQILNYRVGGEYKPHYDYFPPELPGSAPHIARGGQRVSTLVMYLNEVEEGGETVFPNIDLKVAPSPGCAVYFAYTNARDEVDPMTYHGGCPVVRGEKWIATKWMRQREYR